MLRLLFWGKKSPAGAGCQGSDEAYGGVFGLTKGVRTAVWSWSSH